MLNFVPVLILDLKSKALYYYALGQKVTLGWTRF